MTAPMSTAASKPIAAPIITATPTAGGRSSMLHEELARCRMHEAEQAARQHRLVRSMTAGRSWSRLARFAARRAERARRRLDASRVVLRSL